MNVVIIEDEPHASTRVEKLLRELIPQTNVVARHDTVNGAFKWFKENPFPDLVILDIQLADGTAFDLLHLIKIECPIIFTTAFEQYALDAFKTNSIDYLLKPVKKADLSAALDKLKNLRNIFHAPAATATQQPTAQPEYKTRFVIRFGEHIKTIAVADIAYCYSENKNTFARTFDGMNHPMDYNLDSLSEMLNPLEFFRINRQYLINLKSIAEMKSYSKARVIVRLNPPVKEQPIVSSERAADFKNWLDGIISRS